MGKSEEGESAPDSQFNPSLALKGAMQRRGGRHRLERAIEGEVPQTVLRPETVKFLKGLNDIEMLRTLPDSEEELEKWIEEHPDEANNLDDAIQRMGQEFGYEVSPLDPKDKSGK